MLMCRMSLTNLMNNIDLSLAKRVASFRYSNLNLIFCTPLCLSLIYLLSVEC